MSPAGQKIKVLIADQQPLFRQGICSSLTQIADFEVCGEVSSAHELTSTINTSYPDVILLDIDLPTDSGLGLARAVKQQLPSVAVILLTPQPNDDELFQAIKARAAGYINRDVSSDELVTTIRRAAAGEHPINDTFLSKPKVAEQVLQQFQDFSWGKGVEAFVSPLTPRETEILNYMAQGYLNKQIADNLGISEQTIKNHITSILRKLDANARTQAVVTAIRR
ncbi:MAG TPA: response regulator transcription factor, partial [Dehalococcoidia bacterium]|nr:response regulator transcription factor [Dehalococcoidia bacterium]